MFRPKRPPPTVAERLTQIDEHLHDVLKRLTKIEKQGRVIMATNAEVKRLLEEIDAVTNEMAANEAAQAATTAEISADVDSLIALVQAGSEPLSQEALDLAASIKGKVTASTSFGAAQASALTAIAAKHDGSAPPVEPPAPVEP